MGGNHIRADVVTCCSLISALESGGQWLLGLQLFIQMCAGRKLDGNYGPFYKVGLELQEVIPSILDNIYQPNCFAWRHNEGSKKFAENNYLKSTVSL